MYSFQSLNICSQILSEAGIKYELIAMVCIKGKKCGERWVLRVPIILTSLAEDSSDEENPAFCPPHLRS